MLNIIKLLLHIKEKIYKEAYYYLIIMSIYHIFIIFYTYLFQHDFKTKTYFMLTYNSNTANNIIEHMSFEYGFQAFIYSSIIIIIDMVFLILLLYEFKSLNITPFKIIIVEIIVFSLCFYYPVIREYVLFLSLNSIQILIPYKLMKAFPPFKYLFITSSYILLLKFVFTPIYGLIRLYLYINFSM